MAEAYIPYGAYWSTPFDRWQGALAHLHSLRFAAHVAKDELKRRDIPDDAFDVGVLGVTIPQKSSFFGMPWVAAMMGIDGLTGPTINQACATSARCLAAATQEIADGARAALVITADRTSNGPHVYYPAPDGPGGTGANEDWVLGNFNDDPNARCAMVDTAENVARKWQITTAEQHEVVLRRYEQYRDAVKDGASFHKRFMRLPFEVPDARLSKTAGKLEGDGGVYPTTREKLAALKPVREGGTVTYGGQTHPADGNAGMVVATRERARELSRDPRIEVRILGTGMARTETAFMPYAPVPAAERALDAAGLAIKDIDAIKTHNPFAVNDCVFARETGVDAMQMNNFGCSLVWGHPQGPTGLRAVIELVEELALRGGGRGLFTGCAAGDSAMAVVVEVTGA
jgi:acetyl-CoA acetyltransferase